MSQLVLVVLLPQAAPIATTFAARVRKRLVQRRDLRYQLLRIQLGAKVLCQPPLQQLLTQSSQSSITSMLASYWLCHRDSTPNSKPRHTQTHTNIHAVRNSTGPSSTTSRRGGAPRDHGSEHQRAHDSAPKITRWKGPEPSKKGKSTVVSPSCSGGVLNPKLGH